MPRKIVTETTVYTFDELSDRAKEKVREWYRSDFEFDYECIFDDAAGMAEFMGLEIKHIYFSGFYHQGSGACFKGVWRARDVEPGKVKENAPEDKELQRIAKIFEEYARKFPEGYFKVRHRGHYYRSGCTDFDFSLGDEYDLERDEFHDESSEEAISEAEGDLKQASRALMDWIYTQLEKEYEYQNSDEAVDESIRCTEYEFTEDGGRA